MRKRSRLEGLKMPFVVTVAVATGATACGGTVTDQSARGQGETGGSGGSAGSGTGGQDTGGWTGGDGGAGNMGGTWPGGGGGLNVGGGNPPPPPPPSCPAQAPLPGTSCGTLSGHYSGPDCAYGDCYGSPTEFWNCQAVFENAVVQYVWTQTGIATCNPPPPPETTCPAVPPTPGSYCNYVGPSCSYGDAGCADMATCQGYVWTVSFEICNPPYIIDGGGAPMIGGD